MITAETYRPAPDLQPYIHSFWTLSAPPNPEFAGTAFRFVPDGFPEWMFHLKTPNAIRFKGKPDFQQYRSHAIGHFSGYLDMIIPSTGFMVFAIKFHPWSAHLCWEESMKTYTDTLVDLWQGEGKEVGALIDNIHLSSSMETRIQKVEHYLRQKITQPVNQELKYYFQSLQTESHKAPFKIENLLAKKALSPRRVEQIFIEKIGLRPKLVHRIHRIREVIEHIQTHPQQSLTEIAHQFHFFDQSHFTREFKHFTGFTPKWFSHHLNPNTGILNFKFSGN